MYCIAIIITTSYLDNKFCHNILYCHITASHRDECRPVRWTGRGCVTYDSGQVVHIRAVLRRRHSSLYFVSRWTRRVLSVEPGGCNSMWRDSKGWPCFAESADAALMDNCQGARAKTSLRSRRLTFSRNRQTVSTALSERSFRVPKKRGSTFSSVRTQNSLAKEGHGTNRGAVR